MNEEFKSVYDSFEHILADFTNPIESFKSKLVEPLLFSALDLDKFSKLLESKVEIPNHKI